MKWAMVSTWKMSRDGQLKAAELLEKGASADEAAVTAAEVIESNPAYTSVGYGGLPDNRGRVTLDAGFMNGDTLKFGAVGCVEGFKSPIRIARKLAENEFNNFLVGKGAEEYALKNGFEQWNNLTEESYARYLKAKDNTGKLKSYDGHDTVCYVVRDVNGTVCTAVTTSGLFMKEHGRIGDSPLAGCGYYADSQLGGAGCTGVGEDIIRGTVAYKAVSKLKEGKSAQQAADETIAEVMARVTDCRSVSFVLLDKDGNCGVGTNCDFPFVYGSDEDGIRLYLAEYRDGKTAIRLIEDAECELD